MKLNKQTENILRMLGDFAVVMNKADPDNWGVLFNTYQENQELKDEALAISHSSEHFSAIVRWSEYGELTYNKNAPFFSIQEEDFMRNQMKLNADEIKKRMFDFTPKHMFRVPIVNLMNHLEKFDNNEKMKTRIVIRPNHGEVGKGLVLLKAHYDKSFDRMVLKHPKRHELFIPHKDSKFKAEQLIEGKIYQCSIRKGEDNNENIVSVNVKHRFVIGIQIMLYHSSMGYLPDSLDEVLNSNRYPPELVLNVPFPSRDYKYDFEPIMLDCFYISKLLYLYKGFKWLEFHVGGSCIEPVMIVGERDDPSFPLIESLVFPLNPEVRGDRR